MSFKVTYVARFDADLEHETARDLWSGEHGPKADALTDLHTYVQSHVVGALGADGPREGGTVPFDGYSCEWWTDRAAFDAGMRSEAWTSLVEESSGLFEAASMERMCAHLQERIIRDGPTSPYKVVWFARFRDGLDFQEAADHWLNTHAPIALQAPGVDRYVQNLVVGSIGPHGVTDEPVRFDGFSECWFADEATFLAALASEPWQRLNADGLNFLDMVELEGMSAIVEERVIKAGAPAALGGGAHGTA